ncbi:hypothetical protein VPH35_118734 [Triticum aestivum]
MALWPRLDPDQSISGSACPLTVVVYLQKSPSTFYEFNSRSSCVVVTDDARLLWEESEGKQRPRRQGDLTSHPDLRRRSSQIIPNPRATWGPPPRHCRIPYVGRRQPIARSTVRSSRSTTMPMERGGATRPDLAGWTRLQAVADLCSKRCSYRRAATEAMLLTQRKCALLVALTV